MNNWRLLLLAVVVVVLPAGSFTESNLIDGRENCETSKDDPARKTVERRSLNGNLDRRLANEERRFSSRNPERSYETRLGSMLTRSKRYLERKVKHLYPALSESTKHRFTREQESRHRVTRDQTRGIHEGQNRDESRTLVQNERNSLQSRSRDMLDASRIIRSSREGSRRFVNERESRNSISRTPIRTIRSIEERMESPSRATTSQREREDLAYSDSRRDTRFESIIQLDNRGRQAVGNIREDDAEHKQARFSKRENSREIRPQLQRQRSIDLSVRMSANQRYSDRVANQRHESRDTARVNRMDVRNNEKDKRAQNYERRSVDSTNYKHNQNTEERLLSLQQTRASSNEMMTRNDENLERLPHSMDRLSMHRQSRDRLSRHSERNLRDIARIRDFGVEGSEQRRSMDTTIPTLRQTRENSERMREADKTARDVRKSLSEGRQHSRVIRERPMSLASANRKESHRMIMQWDIRETSDERRQQHDYTERTTYRVERETRNNNEIDEFPRTVSLSQLEIHDIDSTSQPEKYDLRRQVFERSMDRAVPITRSTRSEPRSSRDISRASRSAESLRNRDDTNVFERHERRQSRDQYRTIEQTHRNTATSQRANTRKISRIESTRLGRIMRNRDTRENEKRETQRNDDRINMSDERVFEVRMPEGVAARLSQDARNIITREVGSGVSSLAKEMVAERRQDRVDSRNRLEVRSDRNIVERRQESREKILTESRHENRARDTTRNNRGISRTQREVGRERTLKERAKERFLTERKYQNEKATSIIRAELRNRVKFGKERVHYERKHEIRDEETARDGRGKTRSRDEVRSERNLADRRQEIHGRERVLDERKQINREHTRVEARRDQIRSSRLLSDNRMDERFDSQRQQDDRESRITERLAQRTSDRNGLRRESKNQRSLVMERLDQTSSRLIKDVKHEESGFKNIDGAFYRNALETNTSDDSVFSNWQMILYTFQGIYVCGILMQMLTESGNQTKKRTNYWSSPKNLIKVD